MANKLMGNNITDFGRRRGSTIIVNLPFLVLLKASLEKTMLRNYGDSTGKAGKVIIISIALANIFS